MTEDHRDPPREYAMQIAGGSYDWYRQAAIKSRFYHRSTAIAIQVIAAAIPVAAVVAPGNPVIPAILGSAIVVLGALRSTFDWQENYIRFSCAREAVEAERRLYTSHSAPYDDPAVRDRLLIAAVTRIEQEEMSAWTQIAAEPPRQ